ncbi:MAG: NAD(P)(+) transhydrogenase (Re/Si-specific) subunit alpha, partial [Aphanizomenon sp.]
MKIAVAKEIEICERRVALIPDTVAKLVKQDLEVWVEAGAGEQAFFSDADYEAAGAKIISDSAQLWSEADILLKVSPPQTREDGRTELELLKSGSVLISFLNPLGNPVIVQQLANR